MCPLASLSLSVPGLIKQGREGTPSTPASVEGLSENERGEAQLNQGPPALARLVQTLRMERGSLGTPRPEGGRQDRPCWRLPACLPTDPEPVFTSLRSPQK